mmetsp:Transcript_26899/g.40394  ORF Transcript_26899/g.40394 Transcript_26899/m.40394 type:complete len:133 (-) Transcript_26899:258-656(-)
MAGGLFSALMVGFLLESNNSYASVVADSYSQQDGIKSSSGNVDDDEEFWSKLSPEDQVKARELIDKLRASKNGGKIDETATVTSPSPVAATKVDVAATKVEKKETVSVGYGGGKSASKSSNGADSMFSDYDD